MMSVLKVQQLTKVFKKGFFPFNKNLYTVVDTVSFELKEGEIVALLGPNGAGKTTIIHILLGILTPTHGSIYYFGKNFKEHRVDILKYVGYASGYDRLPPRLTVQENLDVVGRIYGVAEPERSERIKKLLHVFRIWHLKDRQTATLSAGQATCVLLAKAFLANPRIVLLDEPTAALDPDIATQVRQFILACSKEFNTTLLITSHNMDEVSMLGDRVLVLKKGSIIADDTPENLAQSIALVRMHFVITQGIELLSRYLEQKKYKYTRHDNAIGIEIDEHRIAELMHYIAYNGVVYSHISIDKPTLEDYFLSIAQ